MRVSVISFSQEGCRLGERICEGLKERSFEVKADTKSKYTKNCLEESVKEWTKKRFEDSDAIVFVGACGIAVRSIAPFVRSKTADPAVVVVDEQGKFAVSLLSGHIGGANKLTQEIADILHAQPVVTTATDLNDRFAVDIFAKKNGCFISDMELAKEVSAALLAGKEVGFASDFPWIGEIPEGLKLCEAEEENPELGIYVTAGYREHPFSHTLYLIPRVITTGVGCRKDMPKEKVENAIRRACDGLLIPSVAMEQVASIDSKKDEAGIQEYCEERMLPFITYTAEQLRAVEGIFTESEFVEKMTGVDNVCERAAVLGSSKAQKGRLILRKYAQDGVTVALAMKKWSVEFE